MPTDHATNQPGSRLASSVISILLDYGGTIMRPALPNLPERLSRFLDGRHGGPDNVTVIVLDVHDGR